MNDFNFLENLPLFILILAFFIVFVMFLFGGFILLKAGKEKQKIERGRRILLNSLYGLLVLLLVVFVFFFVSHLLRKGEVLKPPEVPGEFPPSPAANFPPPPEFIAIGGHPFSRSLSLERHDVIKKPVIYAILCKKNEEYDILYIGQTEEAYLLEHEQYDCWVENCNGNLQDVYLTIFLVSVDKYSLEERERIKEELKNQINPLCPAP